MISSANEECILPVGMGLSVSVGYAALLRAYIDTGICCEVAADYDVPIGRSGRWHSLPYSNMSS